MALVTGANRGIGRAFTLELAARGARVLGGTRAGQRLDADQVTAGVRQVSLDVTDPLAVPAAAASHPEVSIVVNNAGYHAATRLVLTDDPDAARREMEVNYFGVLAMTRAFAPVLAAHGGGAFVNVLSVAAIVPVPFMGGYSPAKAAALWLSTIARAELAGQGTTVTALVVGSVDTRMAEQVDHPDKADPREIARVGCDGLERGAEVVDTDPMAVDARTRLATDPGRFERALARLLDADPVRRRP